MVASKYSSVPLIIYKQKLHRESKSHLLLTHSVFVAWNINFFDALRTQNSSSTVLLYRYAFSYNGQPTMLPYPNSNVAFGQATEMSQNDIDRLNRLYKCCKYCGIKCKISDLHFPVLSLTNGLTCKTAPLG